MENVFFKNMTTSVFDKIKKAPIEAFMIYGNIEILQFRLHLYQ